MRTARVPATTSTGTTSGASAPGARLRAAVGAVRRYAPSRSTRETSSRWESVSFGSAQCTVRPSTVIS